jgi:hypothetical protein
MIRIESPYGRVYKAPPGLLPSVTTILKDTTPKPFSRENWLAKLMRKGLSAYEASIYTERWTAEGASLEFANGIVQGFINTPMSRREASAYADWKTPHSSERGTRLHHFLENKLPVGVGLRWNQRPVAKDATTDLLVQSLWEAGILQQIKEVVSLEQPLWWFRDGIGYAGSEDISYRTYNDEFFNGDWKSKDPKDYSHTKYAHENKLQLIAYAAARKQRSGILVNGSHINYCLSDGSPGEQLMVSKAEAYELWNEWHFRLRAWWSTMGQNLKELRNA